MQTTPKPPQSNGDKHKPFPQVSVPREGAEQDGAEAHHIKEVSIHDEVQQRGQKQVTAWQDVWYYLGAEDV